MNANIKSVQVIGSGCPTCRRLHELAQEAVKQMNLLVTVEYIQDIQKILDMGVMSAPVLAINGRPVLAGGLPTLDKIKELLNANSLGQEDLEKSERGCGCGCGAKY